MLLRLRGPLLDEGEDRPEVVLADGLVVGLGEEVEVEILHVHRPKKALALTDGRSILVLPPRPSRVGLDPLRLDASGPVEIWTRGSEFWTTDAGTQVRLVAGGRVGPLQVVAVPAGVLESRPTIRHGPVLDLTVNPPTLHVSEPRTFTGLPSSLLRALALASGAVHWWRLAQRMWPQDRIAGLRDAEGRRKDLENAFDRATATFAAAGAPDLVIRPGRGTYQLNRKGYTVRV